MSHPTGLKENYKLIKECIALLEEHNKLSYKNESLVLTPIEFAMIKPKHGTQKDSVSLKIIQFYEAYTSQMIVVSKLKKIIEAIAYTNEDLSLHIDRSQDSIVQIFSSLTKNRTQLIKKHTTILHNLEKETEVLIQQITSALTETTNLNEVISTIFVCMEQNGLPDEIRTERPFILVGSKLIESFHKSKKLLITHTDLIEELNGRLKKVVLNVSDVNRPEQTLNRLQQFGIVPDEGDNTNLKALIHDLFGLNINYMESIENSIDPLSKTLKLIEADTGISTGLIIILSPNHDTYFNMESLSTITASFGSSGINDDMISKLDLIKHASEPTVKTSELLTINVDPAYTKMAYVLWTNNFKTFKYKRSPIRHQIIQKILVKSPSSTIEAYNSAFESRISSARSDDAISFNRVRYMSFNESVTEESFLDHFQTKLATTVMNLIGKLTGEKLRNAVIDESFYKELLDVADALKSDIGIHPHLLPAHCHIIYASMASRIVSKLTKDLLKQSAILKPSLVEIVGMIVKTNDNIYSRTIAAYYLHIA